MCSKCKTRDCHLYLSYLFTLTFFFWSLIILSVTHFVGLSIYIFLFPLSYLFFFIFQIVSLLLDVIALVYFLDFQCPIYNRGLKNIEFNKKVAYNKRTECRSRCEKRENCDFWTADSGIKMTIKIAKLH